MLWEVLRAFVPDIACIALLAALHPAIKAWVPLCEQLPFADDRSVMRAYAVRETVPTWGQWVAGYVIPMAIVAWLAVLRYPRACAHVNAGNLAESADARNSTESAKRGWLRETLLNVVGLSVIALLALDITNIVKALTGRPRPDFMNRCLGDTYMTKLATLTEGGTLVKIRWDDCSNAPLVKEGLKSFPSGHSASAFGGCVFAMLLIAHHGQLLPGSRPRALPGGRSHWVLAACVPLLVAVCTAVSRHVDGRHHPGDILAGSALGVVLALVLHRVYCCHAPAVGGGAESTPDRSTPNLLAESRSVGQADASIHENKPAAF